MTVYLEVLFIVNFLYTLLIIYLTAYIMKQESQFTKMLTASLIATILTLILLYLPAYEPFLLLLKISIPIIIAYISYKIKSLSQLLKTVFYFYFISFLFGGGLYGVQQLIQHYSIRQNTLFLLSENSSQEQISLSVLMVSTVCFVKFIKYMVDEKIKKQMHDNFLYEIELILNNKQLSMTGFLDTGNQLTEPVTNQPVIFCEPNAIKSLFSDNEWIELQEVLITNKIPKKLRNHYRFIPLRTVALETEKLLIIKPDKLIIKDYNRTIETKKVFLGLSYTTFASDEEFDCLLHPHLFYLTSEKIA